MSVFEIQFWLSLLTLTALEIVLGIDNLVFLSLVSSSVEKNRQKLARRLGLLGALLMRLFFLGGVFWLIKLTVPLFYLYSQGFSVRDLLMIFGGAFLIVKGTLEIHTAIEKDEDIIARKTKHWVMAIMQIMVFDIIFSLDSIMTAVGLTDFYLVMVIAIIIAMIIMLMASETIHHFIVTYPTVKMLALSFLLLIGMVLVADGFKFHVPREYIYFAIIFSLMVELLNNIARSRISSRKSKKTRG